MMKCIITRRQYMIERLIKMQKVLIVLTDGWHFSVDLIVYALRLSEALSNTFFFKKYFLDQLIILFLNLYIFAML